MYLAHFKKHIANYPTCKMLLMYVFFCPAHKYVCYGNYADEECCMQNNNVFCKVEKETFYLVERQQLESLKLEYSPAFFKW
jgi:hypothetical protein